MYDHYEKNPRNNRRPKVKTERAECPFCFSKVNVGDQPRIGQLAVCPGCKTELEVVWLSPLELDSPIIDDEDDEFFVDDYDDPYDEVF